MFSKHRNAAAWIFILLASLLISAGIIMLSSAHKKAGSDPSVPYDTTSAETQIGYEIRQSGVSPAFSALSASGNIKPSVPRGKWIITVCLFVSGLICAAFSFVLYPKKPLQGPDGSLLLLALALLFIKFRYADIIFPVFLTIVTAREIIGWIKAKFNLNWCSVKRIVSALKNDTQSVVFMCVNAVLLTEALFVIPLNSARNITSYVLIALTDILGFVCICSYGSELKHFRKQISSFTSGSKIEIKDGVFADAERQLDRIQIQNKEAIEKAVADERFKVDLISNVSHDLRTPLTSIIGYGELLNNEKMSENGQKQLAVLNQKSEYMRELVDSLFELTKVSSGVLKKDMKKIDIVSLLEQTLGLLDDRIKDAELDIRRYYESDKIPVTTDGNRMHRVFDNLIGNAIKYALPSTRVYLHIYQKDGYCTIRIVNTASYDMDFDPEEITERFVRADKARSTSGSGIGLAIAKTYTESVGGNFKVRIDGDQFNAFVSLPSQTENER